MAQIQDSTKKKQRPISSGGCFLGCFGFSESPKKVKENPSKKVISWFSWSKNPPKKTVPVVDAATEKLHKRKESFRVAKLSKKFSTSQLPRKIPVDSSVPPLSQIPAATGGDETVHGRQDKTKDEKINLENGKSLNHSDSITKELAPHKKGVFRRNSWSQPTPPEDKNEVNRGAATSVLSHSPSLPPPSTGTYPAGNGGAGGNSQESKRKNNTWADKFDQLVGMSIIVVTLLIMIIWGKLFAILCTSAWLYFYPTLRATKNDEPKHLIRNSTKSLDLDIIESKKLKKKVVFEGFLERSHRVN